MANKKINELATRTPSLTDLLLVGEPSSGYSYKATITAVSNVIETSIANTFVTLGTTQTISGAKTFSNTITATSVANAPSSTGKFLVLNASNVINYRTSAEVLSDIGAQGSITLTTTGTSGAATLVGNTLNIPNYGSALSGYVPTTRTLTINGTAYDLSADRTWSVGTVTSVAMTVPTGLTVSGTPITSSGTLAVSLQSGYSIPTTASQTNWDAAYNDKINSAAVTGTTTKTLTLTQQDGGTVTASWSDLDSGSITGSGTTNYIPKFTSSSAIGNSTMLTDANGNIIVSSGQTWGTSAGGLNLSSVSDDGYVTTYYDNKNLTLGAGVTSKNRIVIEGQAGGNNINFNVFGSERMRLTSTGLGIGTSSPAEKLHVYEGASGASLPTYVQSIFEYNANGGIAIAVPDNSSAAIVFPTSGNSSYSFIDRSGTNLRFGNNGSERMRIDASGNLGLGVTPSAWSAGKAFEMTSVGNGVWASPDIYLFRNSYYNSGWKYAANGAAGNYYIGSSGEHVWSQAASGTAGNAISFTQAMTLAASGNLGIGVTNPDSYNSYAYRLVVGGLANSGITIAGDASEGSSNLYFADGTTGDQAYRGFLSYTHSNDYLTIGTSGTTRMTITSGGNVGIATSAPDGKLDVNGTSYFRDDLILYGTKKLYLDSGSDTYLTEVSANTMQFVTGGSERMRITSGGDLIVGSSTGNGRLTVRGTGTSSAAYAFEAANSNGNTLFIVRNDGVGYFSNNVGIGTFSPSAALTVSGINTAAAIDFTNTTATTGRNFRWVSLNSGGFAIEDITASAERMRITSGGNVGIGTTTPAVAGSLYTGLHINGNGASLILSKNDANYVYLYTVGTGDFSIENPGAQIFRAGSAERMRINSAGRVSIDSTADLGRNLVIGGTSSTARVVPATDNVGYVGDVSYRWEAIYAVNGTIQTSDAREKREIKTTNLGLDFVKSLNPVSYKWNENYSDNRTHYGLIAQQVKTAIPTGVDFGGLIEEENNGRKSIIYTEFIAVLIKAIQEQQAQIEQLKK